MAGEPKRGALAYLCLETPREGQAVHTHVYEIVKGLRAAGWEVELITTEAGGASAGRSFWRRGLDFARAQARLISQLSRFDAVYMRSHPAAIAATHLAWLRGVPVFQEVNGTPTDLIVTYPRLGRLAPLVAWAYRAQLKRAAHVFAVTDGLRDWVRAFAAHDRVTVVPNGANTEIFRRDGAKGEIEGRYIIFVGGLVAWHGIDTMLSATRHPNWPAGVKLVIAGDGVERSKVAAETANARLLWLGRLPQLEIPSLMRGAIAALCVIENPAERSATGIAPIKLFEAMACGTAVIASELPFQADIVRQLGAGLVVPMGDPGALADAAAKLAAAPAEAQGMGARGSAYVRAHASWQVRADTTGQVIGRIVDAR
ncbi:MAG: glycosyltransferase [Hyphomicrobiaceae bacterium]